MTGQGTKKKGTKSRAARRKKADSYVSNVESGYENVNAPKIVVLGADGSGKSTLFKQVELKFGHEMEKLELEVLLKDVHRCMAEGMLALLALADVLDLDFFDQVENKERLQEMPVDVIVTPVVGKIMNKVWQCDAAQEAWKQRGKRIPDSFAYFMGKVADVSKDNYVPTPEDYLHISVHSSTITTAYVFGKEGATFRLYDIGSETTFFGNARKRKLLMENVVCFLFAVSVSDFDEPSMTHEDENYIESSLGLFNTLLTLMKENMPNAQLILVLNKTDHLKEKLQTVPFRIEGKRFDDFPGSSVQEGSSLDQAYAEVMDYVQRKFEEKTKEYECELTVHRGNALDVGELEPVFEKVSSLMAEHESES